MKVSIEPFLQQVAKTPLKACYWLAGDEPWQLKTLQEALWKQAEVQGYAERLRFDVTATFDWVYWSRDIHSQSLFSSQRLIELRLNAGKLSDAGSKAVLAYCQRSTPDTVLVIISPKIETHAASQKVITLVEAKGVVCQVWPLERQQLTAWFTKQLQLAGLATSSHGLQCLVDYTEGNLLAGAQAIALLALLYPQQTISLDHIEQSLSHQARFDVFSLGEAFLRGDALRYNTMLMGLKAEGVEPILVLWALVKEIRLLLQLSDYQASGQALQSIWPTLGIWDKRRPLYQQALQAPRDWSALMIQASECDVMLKGFAVGDPWQVFSRML